MEEIRHIAIYHHRHAHAVAGLLRKGRCRIRISRLSRSFPQLHHNVVGSAILICLCHYYGRLYHHRLWFSLTIIADIMTGLSSCQDVNVMMLMLGVSIYGGAYEGTGDLMMISAAHEHTCKGQSRVFERALAWLMTYTL